MIFPVHHRTAAMDGLDIFYRGDKLDHDAGLIRDFLGRVHHGSP